MVNNGSQHYDHDRDGTHTEMAGCEAQFRGSPHETYLAIRYEDNKLTVSELNFSFRIISSYISIV